MIITPRGRPKKISNESTQSVQVNSTNNIETSTSNNSTEEYQESYNSYIDYVQNFIENHFTTNMFNDGVMETAVKPETLKKWFANPDRYQREISKYMEYMYITEGGIHQLYDLVRTLPSLNYKIEAIDKNSKYEKNINLCNRHLKRIKHKELTRDLLSQTVSSGTTTGIWMGDKKPYLYVFDDVFYFFPAFRRNGEWVIYADMSYLNTMQSLGRQIFFESLYPYITQEHYNKYLENPAENQYVELPTDRTICIRTHVLKRSQGMGNIWGTEALYDIQQKYKMKNMDASVANKIIRAIAVLTIGSEDEKDYSNMKLPKAVKKKLYEGVKKAMEKSEDKGVTVVAIPEYSNLKFPEMNGDALKPEKYESINRDTNISLGISDSMTYGGGTNYASAKLHYEVFYKKIGELLEQVEECYNKLFNLILPSSQEDNYSLIYDKEAEISKQDKVNTLLKLHSEGFSVKGVIDCLSGVDFGDYISQTDYETKILQLQEWVKPFNLNSTTSGNGDVGRNKMQTGDKTESGIATEANDSNSINYN